MAGTHSSHVYTMEEVLGMLDTVDEPICNGSDNFDTDYFLLLHHRRQLVGTILRFYSVLLSKVYCCISHINVWLLLLSAPALKITVMRT